MRKNRTVFASFSGNGDPFLGYRFFAKGCIIKKDAFASREKEGFEAKGDKQEGVRFWEEFMAEKVMLIDGNSLLNRAFYGVPLLTNSKGQYTNAIHGFFHIILK